MEPRLTATLVIQSSRYYGHFLWPPGKNNHTFTWKETPVNIVIFLLWPNFFDPLVTVLTGFHCVSFLGFMLDWLLNRIELKAGFHNTQARNTWQTPKNVCVGVSQIWSYCHVSGSILGGDWSSYCREGKVADHLHKSWKQVCLFLKNASFVLVSPICPQPSQMIKDVYDFLHSLLPVPPLPQTYGSGRQGFWKPDLNWPVWSFPFQQSQHGMCPSNPED